MADETPQLPSDKELSQLPHRAIVAYAVRAARRVQPLCVKAWPNNSDKRTSLIDAVERALDLTFSFSRGESVAADELHAAAAYAATHVADAGAAHDQVATHVAAAAAAYVEHAYVAAVRAADAAYAAYTSYEGDTPYVVDAAKHFNAASRGMLIAACRRDFERLVERQTSKPAEMKRKVSPSERGFLGSLWIGEPPDWYTELKPQLDAILKGKDAAGSDQSSALKNQLAEREQTI